MAENLFGILGGLALGVLVAMFVPFGISIVIVVGLIVVIILPQFMRYRIPATLALLAIVGIMLVRIYVYKQTL